MNALSAIIYGASGFVTGVIGELWHMRRDPSYSPKLGFEGAFIGLALFALLFSLMIFSYAALSRRIRRDKEPVRAYAWSAVLGLPFWVILLPTHTLLRDRLGLPDALWWIESAVLCITSFEAIRLLDSAWTKEPNQPPEPTR